MEDAMPFVTGSDVQAMKDRLNPSFVATHAAVHACAGAPPASVLAWDVFFASWNAFLHVDETAWLNQLGAGGRADLTEQYGKDLVGWQAQIQGWRCQLLAPPVVPSPHQTPPVIAEAATIAKPTVDVLNSIALVAGVLLLGYVAVVYVPKFLPAVKGAK
jgi:hypothetical protein